MARAIDRFAYSRNGGGNGDEKCLIRVNIPTASQEHKHTRYQVVVMNIETHQTWHVWHRYSEFLRLRDELLKFLTNAPRKCPGCVNYAKVIQQFEFPSKHYFTSLNPVVVNYRKKALRAFVALLASHTFTASPKCPTCSDFPFTAVRDFLTEEPVVPSGESVSSSGSDVLESIRESMDVKKFTSYVPVPGLKSVNSEGVFIGEDGKPMARRAHGSGSKTSSSSSPPASTAASTESPAAAVPVPPKAAGVVKPSKKTNVREDPEDDPPNEGSFVSFSGPAPPPARTENRGGRQQGDKRELAQPPRSMDDGMDEEFGSLNMDFLKNISGKE